MKRSYLYIIVGVIVLAVVAFLIFMVRSGFTPASLIGGNTGSLPNVGTQTGSGNSGGTGETGSNGGIGGVGSGSGSVGEQAQSLAKNFGVVSDQPILEYFVDAENNVVAVEPDGTIIKVSGGQSSVLSSSKIAGLIGADFSYDGGKALVNFGDPANPQSSIFDIATKSWTPLPQGFLSPRWAPSDYRIAYFLGPPTGSASLATIDASNLKKSPVVLLTLNIKDLVLKWFNKNQIILSDKPSAYMAGSVWLFDLQKKTLSSLAFGLPGLESIWNGPTSSSVPMGLIFSSGAAGRGGSLHLVDLSGKTIEDLSIFTLPSKCAFGAEKPTAPSSTPYLALYCGVPRDQSQFPSGHFPDDYEMKSVFTADGLYRVNMNTGEISTVLNDPSQSFDVSDLKRFNNGMLFFINRYDQKLYALSLVPQ